MEYTIPVQLENKRGEDEKGSATHDDCVCTHPVPGDQSYKVRVNRGDLVRWAFDNKSRAKVEVGIGHFQQPTRYSKFKRAAGDRDPLEEKCTRKLILDPGGFGVLECRIKNNFEVEQLTWKYDIIRYQDGDERVLLDPELEIPNRGLGD